MSCPKHQACGDVRPRHESCWWAMTTWRAPTLAAEIEEIGFSTLVARSGADGGATARRGGRSSVSGWYSMASAANCRNC